MTQEDDKILKPVMRDRKEIAAIFYHELKDNERATFDISATYGRWLINSLFLIHSGALFGMFTFLAALAPSPDKIGIYTYVIAWLLGGLSFALLSGFTTWLNWSSLSDAYREIADIRMLWDGDHWPDTNKTAPLVTWTYWLSLVFGFTSFFCIWLAAYELISGNGLLKQLIG